ncbi:uncharacterized protein LOC132727560 [Ruditapes philippinarum]|uniref:uncharacterized protein LOC132727560 n=1 Tax=Ruditapes philippinarum TaxID=129788 RepID=UPI00295AAC0F|nr:uncharacterized protein LOC132727560 [Ruditapes philippinarum]
MSSHNMRIIKVEPSDGTGSLPPVRADTKKLMEQQIMLANKRSQVFTYKGPEKTRSRSVPDRTFKEAQFTYAREQSIPRTTEARYRDDFSDSSDEELEEEEIKLTNTQERETEQLAALEYKEEKQRQSMAVSTNKGRHYICNTISLGISINLKENEEIDKKDQFVKGEKEDSATTTKESDQRNDNDKKKKKIKLPSCFGFISTWVAKRKEKRREKKRKAIASRAPTPTLVQYEHRKARGGESFVIEVDCKPIQMKPILPPIKKADGPIRLACEARQERAEAKRNEELFKKKELAKEHQRKKIECKQRKDESEHRFQERVRLTIRYRQADAERNRSRMLSQRASISRMSTRARSSLAVSSSPESVDEGNKNALKDGSSH